MMETRTEKLLGFVNRHAIDIIVGHSAKAIKEYSKRKINNYREKNCD